MTIEVKFTEDQLQVIKQYITAKVTDSHTDGVVIGISGGLDSAVLLKVCTEIFPAENISPVFLPESTTPADDAKHAKLIAELCKVSLIEIRIDDILKSYPKDIQGLAPDPVALGNLKARIRMNILYLIANSRNRLVLGTSNKSELLLGYFTKFGDGGSDVAPIGDLYKTQVKQLARHLNIPDEIIEKPPAAGLIADQTDEDELGLDYKTIDRILTGLDRNMAASTIATKLNLAEDIIIKLNRRVEVNRHKRKFAKIPKLGLKTIGVDRYE